MAGRSTISITFRLDGDSNDFRRLANNADGLREAMQSAVVESTRLNRSLINWSQAVQAVSSITTTIDNVSNAISSLSQKMGDMQREAVMVTQLTGKTGEEMMNLRNGVKATADQFGAGFSETMQAVNALTRAFGITAEDALKLVQDGFVSGADANGQFIDTLREYPRYFREAGVSAEEFIAITANAAKQGIYSDKGVDVIKEGNLRIREMTTATADAMEAIGISATEVQQSLQEGSLTTFDVMQMVADKLAELPASSAAVGTAIADIFGGPGEDAGLEYIKSLSSAQLSMEALKASTNGTAEAQEKQLQMQTELSNSMTGLIDLSAIYTNAKPYIEMTAQIGMATAGVTSLIGVLKALNIQQAITAARAIAIGVAHKAMALAGTIKAFISLTREVRTAKDAMLLFNMVCRANPIGLLVTALVAAASAVLLFRDRTDAATEALKAEKKEIEDFNRSVSDAAGKSISAYRQLQTEYGKCKSAHEKREWIRQSQTRFQELGISVNGVNDAESIFVRNTEVMMRAFKKRAEAAAYQTKLNDEYTRRINRQMDLESKMLNNVQAGSVVPGGTHSAESGDEYVNNAGQWVYTEQGAQKARERAQQQINNDPVLKQIDERINAYVQRISDVSAELDGLMSKAGTSAPKTVAPPVTPPTTPATTSATTTTSTAGGTTLNENATTLREISGNISYLNEQLKDASIEEAALINQQIDDWEAKAEAIRNAGRAVEETGAATASMPINESADTLATISDNIEVLNAELQNATIEEAGLINQQIAGWEAKAEAIRNAGRAAEETGESISKSLTDGWNSIKGIGGSIEGITDALQGNSNAWQTITSLIDGFIGLYTGISQIVAIIGSLTQATQTQTAATVAGATASTAASAGATAAKNAETTANVAAAASGAMSAHSSIPIVGIALGLAAVAAIIAMMASLPKFAKGGIVSGPTLGLMGEYAGAGNNPEVVAPLDKLRGMLREPGGTTGRVEFEIKGRTLVGILNKENNVLSRS